MVLDILKYVMAAFFLFAGVMHFAKPKFFLRIIPPILPFKEAINYISGAAEIVLAIMLVIPATSVLGAWGIIALLIAVFPANVYQLMAKGAGMKVPIWGLWLRLPFQGVLIYWSYLYTQPI